MRRVLLLSATTGYQLRAFGEAAARLEVELLFGTDRCRHLDDPWRDRSIPVRWHDEGKSLAAIEAAAGAAPVDGVLALGDRPTVLAAQAAERLGLPGNPPAAARAASNKRLSREKLTAAGLPTPWFTTVPLQAEPGTIARALGYPCVVKPLALAGSRGVIRADDPRGFIEAFERLRRILRRRDVRVLRDPSNEEVLIEGFVPGREFAIEGLLERGSFRTLAIFDKPDPLDGPYFEETIYATPSRTPVVEQGRMREAVIAAADAIGLRHGPVHAECRVNDEGVFVHEVAARPIGGLCARALRFDGPAGPMAFEELLLRHALGEAIGEYRRERRASAVMMIPIPRWGFLKDVRGADTASAVPGVDEITITATRDQILYPPPEGASYLGFVFASGETPREAVVALRAAHAGLEFVIEAPLTLVE